MKKETYWSRNKEAVSKQQKEYNQSKNGKKIRRNYFLKNRKQIYFNMNEYAKKNRHIINPILKRYRKKRLSKDINFRISCNLRTRLYIALRNKTKSDSLTGLLGCSIDDFKEYIGSKFKEDMSWDNYGAWHIDHVKPCASFDLSKEEEQKECFHYTNLQPLWAEDNLKKSSSII